MPAKKVAMASCYTDSREAIFWGRKRVVLIGDHTWDGEGKLVAKMEFAEPEGLGLEVIQGSLNELAKHGIPKME